MRTKTFEKVLDSEYVTIRHCPDERLLWNEWKGAIPSGKLRAAVRFASEYVAANNIELILADFSRMHAPSREDQVWIARTGARILQHSKLRKVANLTSSDIFGQIALETIYDIAAETPLPCEVRNFISEQSAAEWLYSKER
ncbi:hypothetical protein H7F15_16695 [Pontibacter sp. Tf4]|uniref:hypothetical protein n=1 Tax=Pontibacter sp. Tf4 TaxID=2761620 RepID=UPI001626D311|nr:hypothetical protein [Pontibacter sp. Tf4]MBB6612683.1 hypothetical protein [Pontibacter sp. Tf4]